MMVSYTAKERGSEDAGSIPAMFNVFFMGVWLSLVEGARLEIERGLKASVGSNPTAPVFYRE